MPNRFQPFRYYPEQSLKNFLHANRFFLIGVGLLLSLQLYLLATNGRGDLLIYLNGKRTVFGDTFFRFMTDVGSWPGYLIAIILAAAFRYRTAIFTLVTGVTTAVVVAGLKNLFGEKRPLKWFGDGDWTIVEALNRFPEEFENWGENSFPSGHTAAGFALFSFLCFNVKRPKILISTLCFLLALTVGFSRMYLLYHFLQDVTAGAIIGVLIGVVMYMLQWSVWKDSTALNQGFWNKKVV